MKRAPSGAFFIAYRLNIFMNNHFICAICEGDFIKQLSDEEVAATELRVFGPQPKDRPREIVCEICYLAVLVDGIERGIDFRKW
jgi:hypothetical protein